MLWIFRQIYKHIEKCEWVAKWQCVVCTAKCISPKRKAILFYFRWSCCAVYFFFFLLFLFSFIFFLFISCTFQFRFCVNVLPEIVAAINGTNIFQLHYIALHCMHDAYSIRGWSVSVFVVLTEWQWWLLPFSVVSIQARNNHKTLAWVFFHHHHYFSLTFMVKWRYCKPCHSI